MSLLNEVSVNRRFQRSIKIDTDLTEPSALEGFVCPKSSLNVLKNMSQHLHETGQSAFTWTGPYGSGKSSLVIALSSVISGSDKVQKQAREVLGKEAFETISQAFPQRSSKVWTSIPIVGRRDDPAQVIGETLLAYDLVERTPESGWTDQIVTKLLQNLSSDDTARSGLVLFVDEMGKFLEASARKGSDVYLFQLLAETASRSGGRFIVIGVLHQAFEEYATRLSREARDEWSKIQGRFVDLPVNTAGEEQLDLLSRAIITTHHTEASKAASIVANEIKSNKPGVSSELPILLEGCWPIHPATAALLGPISKRRFGQNQRSIFGFLNSAEIYGFQDFLKSATDSDLYTPERLWDYLRANLEPAIMASPDGHRWATAVEVCDRCEANASKPLEVTLLKTIAILDLFKEGSGLLPSTNVLKTITKADGSELKEALDKLAKSAYVIYRKHLSAYAVYAGSDFDLESAVDQALNDLRDVDLTVIQNMAGLQPILAKRHYFHSGALRWMDVKICALRDVESSISEFHSNESMIGKLVLAFPTEGESTKTASSTCKKASLAALREGKKVLVGFPTSAWNIIDMAKELKALEKVEEESSELQGDKVARREIISHRVNIQNRLESELESALISTVWYIEGTKFEKLTHGDLNNQISSIADDIYYDSPHVQNELLNRNKPSSSAAAAQNILLKAMLTDEGTERLGFKGFPAEAGLFDSILSASNLYVKKRTNYQFSLPEKKQDALNIRPIYEGAINLLKSNQDRAVSIEEIYQLWSSPPYGVKHGLMPTLAAAFMLIYRDSLAFYNEGVFLVAFTEHEASLLPRQAGYLSIRWMDFSQASKELLSGYADILRSLDPEVSLDQIEPLDIAVKLVALFDRHKGWVERTQKLSGATLKIRTIFKKANDPNRLFFNDLPDVCRQELSKKEISSEDILQLVKEALTEYTEAFDKELFKLKNLMLSELDVPNDSPQAIRDLNSRAKNVGQKTGDLKMDNLIRQLAKFTGSLPEMHRILDVITGTPTKDWTDRSIELAVIEVASYCERFIKLETVARVRGRKNSRHSMALVISKDNKAKPKITEFSVANADLERVDLIASKARELLSAFSQEKRDVLLAALAEVSSDYFYTHDDDSEDRNVAS